jgi:hypothetical protein
MKTPRPHQPFIRPTVKAIQSAEPGESAAPAVELIDVPLENAIWRRRRGVEGRTNPEGSADE